MMPIPKGLIPSLRDWRRRVATSASGLAAITLVASGTAWGLAGHPGVGAAAQPQLTANTNAGCNSPQPAGYARCFAIVRTPANHQITPDAAGPPAAALGPADIQSAYKLPAAGGGQTVAIVDALGDSAAESDLATFRANYGLPPCTTANGCFKKVDQNGGTSYPPDDGGYGWALETSLDLDAVSSACPACNILLVEANSASDADLGAAVDEAVSLGAKYVSNSYGSSDVNGHGVEYQGETGNDPFYNHPGVAVIASAGDGGWGVSYPAASPYVTSVGGTKLTKDSSVARGWDETVWGNGTQGGSGDGTGSGCSQYEPEPDFQQAISTGCGNRAIADIAADADPASGLAIYDTLGDPGWLQVGGTSLASPLIAAAYALSGTPQPGSYPVSYPYHDPNQAQDLFDITTGSNGNCGTLLCQAGPGWDGPTGLGTPDGVAALTSGPQGVISGQVTDTSTGKPIEGAIVAASPGSYATRTDSAGHFQFNIPAGSYTVTVTDYGYQTATQTGVTVTASQTTTENYTLTPGAFSTLSGTVTDAGHGWPLYAQITVPGYPGGPLYTNPSTGAYSVKLPDNASYTLHVTPVYPGYQASDTTVQVGSADQTQDITQAADLTACTAPGYGPSGLTESFAGWRGATPADGWQVASPGAPGWRFDNPGNRPEPPSIAEQYIPGLNVEAFAAFAGDSFAVADAGFYSPQTLHTTLTSAAADLTGQTTPQLTFDSAYYPAGGRDSAEVQLSVDAGRTWSTIWHQTTSNALGPITIAIPQAAGKSGVRARWVFTGSGLGYWAVGPVLIGTGTCAPQPGGLVTGVVTDQASGTPLNGATIADTAPHQPYPWPEGTALAGTDPALPGGFYWLFTPSGSRKLSAAASGYTSGSATVSVTQDQVTHHDWALSPAGAS